MTPHSLYLIISLPSLRNGFKVTHIIVSPHNVLNSPLISLSIFETLYSILLSSVISASAWDEVRNINVQVSPDINQPENCSSYLLNLETLISNSLHLADDVTVTR